MFVILYTYIKFKRKTVILGYIPYVNSKLRYGITVITTLNVYVWSMSMCIINYIDYDSIFNRIYLYEFKTTDKTIIWGENRLVYASVLLKL